MVTKTINVLEYALLLILATPTCWWLGKRIGRFLGRLLGQIVVFFLGAQVDMTYADGTKELIKLRFFKAVKWCNWVETERQKAKEAGTLRKSENKNV